MTSIEQRIHRIVSELFALPADGVVPESSPQTIEKWDSVGHLNLVIALEQEFRIAFSPEQIEQMTDVREIVGLVAHASRRSS